MKRAAVPLLLLLIFAIYATRFLPLLDGHAHTMGLDYWSLMPRLVADYYWFKLNGWHEVPWFTPAFCGGFPDWANPQSMPYSVPQLLLRWVDPVHTIQLTFLIEAALGLVGTWLLLRRGFRTSSAAALLGATLFLFNGFFVARMVIGHLPMHPFMLAPLVAWLLIRARQNGLELALDGVLAGLLFGGMLQGGAHVIVPPICLAWVSIGVLHILRGGSGRDFVLRLFGALVVGVLLSASKLVAMSALLTQFPRDQYPLPGYASWGALLSAVGHSLFGRPDTSVDAMVDAFYAVDAHEREYGLSPAPLVLLIAALLLGRRRPAWWQRKGMLIGLLALLLLTPLALNLHGAYWTPFLKHLPIIRSSSSLYRYVVLYVIVIPVLSAAAVDRLPRPAFWAAGGMLLAIGWSVTGDWQAYFAKSYRTGNMVRAWQSVHDGGSIPDISFMDLRTDPGGKPVIVIGADDVFSVGASNVTCYEPIFGYALEKLPWKPLHHGPALDVSDGVLNVKNPTCDLYPAENGCRPGEHFKVSDRERAEAFLSWQPIPFVRPLRQKVADAVSLLTLVALPAVLGGLLVAVRRRHARPAA